MSTIANPTGTSGPYAVLREQVATGKATGHIAQDGYDAHAAGYERASTTPRPRDTGGRAGSCTPMPWNASVTSVLTDGEHRIAQRRQIEQGLVDMQLTIHEDGEYRDARRALMTSGGKTSCEISFRP